MVGNPDAAFSGAATIVEAEYEVPFQGHTAVRRRPCRRRIRRTDR